MFQWFLSDFLLGIEILERFVQQGNTKFQCGNTCWEMDRRTFYPKPCHMMFGRYDNQVLSQKFSYVTKIPDLLFFSL